MFPPVPPLDDLYRPLLIPGMLVKIDRSDGNIDQHQYRIIKSERNIVWLRNETLSKEPCKVHWTRIRVESIISWLSDPKNNLSALAPAGQEALRKLMEV